MGDADEDGMARESPMADVQEDTPEDGMVGDIPEEDSDEDTLVGDPPEEEEDWMVGDTSGHGGDAHGLGENEEGLTTPDDVSKFLGKPKTTY